MAENVERYTVRVHQEPGHDLWAEVLELPGCFASGAGMDELRQALTEAIGSICRSRAATSASSFEDEPGTVSGQHVLARTA
jgi:hypothetical protein